jgi:hypothetical protein
MRMFREDQSVISNIVRTEITKVLQSATIAQNIGIAKILLADCVFKREKRMKQKRQHRSKAKYLINIF